MLHEQTTKTFEIITFPVVKSISFGIVWHCGFHLLSGSKFEIFVSSVHFKKPKTIHNFEPSSPTERVKGGKRARNTNVSCQMNTVKIIRSLNWSESCQKLNIFVMFIQGFFSLPEMFMNWTNGSSSTRQIHLHDERHVRALSISPQIRIQQKYQIQQQIRSISMLSSVWIFTGIRSVCTPRALLNRTDEAKVLFSTVWCTEVFGWCYWAHIHFIIANDISWNISRTQSKYYCGVAFSFGFLNLNFIVLQRKSIWNCLHNNNSNHLVR